MGYFPLCIELSGKCVLCVGTGAQTQDKIEKIRPFGPRIVVVDALTEEQLEEYLPELVIVGDTERSKAEQSPFVPGTEPSGKCGGCTGTLHLFLPSLITRGDLTISVSTGGTSPAAAAHVRREIEEKLPDRTEEILQWLGENRSFLREQGILKEATRKALFLNRPLTAEECELLGK